MWDKLLGILGLIISLCGGFFAGIICILRWQSKGKKSSPPKKSKTSDHKDSMEKFLTGLGNDPNLKICRLDSFLPTLCNYDPSSKKLHSIQHLTDIACRTECVFAKDVKAWGSQDWDFALTQEENYARSLSAFALFASVHRGIDAFAFEICEPESCDTVEAFGTSLRRLLKFLSDRDPSGYRCMDKSFVGKRGWVFSFGGSEFFLTTLAPCYAANHSRYAWEEKNGFVIFQPYHSFLWHNVGHDVPASQTNWEIPKTMRDRIRVGFKKAGRPYFIPENPDTYPIAHGFVRPMDSMSATEVVEWWKDPVQIVDTAKEKHL